MCDRAKKTTTEIKKARSQYQPAGRWIRVEKRLAINLRDSFRCVYCCRDLHGAAPGDVTLDHIKPKADGGTNDESNLVTACRTCNCSRQDTPIARFCGPETRADIRRLTKRSLKPYLKLAKAYFEDKVGMEELTDRDAK
jgi:5-methylcytosine-specific restriction endonuclease McrA